MVSAALVMGSLPEGSAAQAPNVIVVITDDQGYGDVSAHGNPVLKTPQLDRLHAESVRLTNFHVAPVCSPTRARLMTGRYAMRGAISGTIAGISLLRNDGPIMADFFRESGYATGMFGKWHLGDNAPSRPEDRGFDRVVRHAAGGIMQTGDAWNNNYFNDRYFADGELEQYIGYCTDVFFDEAMSYMRENRDRPFFVYLAPNAPHAPFNAPEKYSRPYLDEGVPEAVAHFYGMLANFDENMGRLMDFLNEQGLEQNTILIFMGDNGSVIGTGSRARRHGWEGWDAGRRGGKGQTTEGGHGVPFFVRWPAGGLKPGSDVDMLTADIDILPTFIDLCGLKPLDHAPFDGQSIAPLLADGKHPPNWPERTLYTGLQTRWAVMTDRWRLITMDMEVDQWELYDVLADPSQKRDLAAAHPEIVDELKGRWAVWHADVSRGVSPRVPILIGDERENPAMITAHDWAYEPLPPYADPGPGHNVPWNQYEIRKMPWANGTWTIEVAREGLYRFVLGAMPLEEKHPLTAARARLSIGEQVVERHIEPEWVATFTDEFRNAVSTVSFDLRLPAGKTTMRTALIEEDGRERGAFFVRVERL